jgi:tetratricopeptide (TPR) repeat protein
LYFENIVDSEDEGKTAQMIMALLITDLSESDYMYVISRQRLYDILKLLGEEDRKVIDRSVASDVAERAGAKWILTGSILQTDPVLVITSDISDVSSGRVIATQRVTGESDEDLFAVVDRLSAAVKHDLALPVAAEREADRPVAEFTTHSAEAYRHYLEGVEYVNKFYTTEAVESFRRAIESDSTFAMAYYRMARENPSTQGRLFAAKAVEYVDRTSEREGYLIKSLHATYSGNYMEAVRILEEAAERYPDDKEIHHEMAIVYGFEVGDIDKCIEELLKVVELDPVFPPAYNQLAYSYHEAGDFEKSIWAIDQYVSLVPDEANPYDSRGDLYAFNGKIEEAIGSYEEAVRIKPDFWVSIRKLGNMHLFRGEHDIAEQYYRELIASPDTETRSSGRLCLAYIPAYQGRFEAALQVLDDGIAADRMEQYEGAHARTKHRLKSSLHLIRNEFEAAQAEATLYIETGMEFHPFLRIYAWPVYIVALARGGKMEEAEREAEELKTYIIDHDETEIEWYWLARGHTNRASGDASSAVSKFEKVKEIDPQTAKYSRYRLGESYIELGRLADAIAELQKLLYRYDDYRATIPTYVVRAHYLLGRAYEESGWNDRAIEQYEIFLEIWKDADPGIPEIDDARERLAGLGVSS